MNLILQILRNKTVLTILPWLLCGVLLIIMIRSCSNNAAQKAQLISNLSIVQDSVKHFKNQNGQLVNQVGVLKIDKSELREELQVVGVDRDKMKKQVGNLNNLVSFYKGQLQVKGNFKTKAKDTFLLKDNNGEWSFFSVEDSTKTLRKTFSFNNRYLSLHELYNPVDDSVKAEYTYSTKFTYTVYDKKEGGFLKPKKIVTYADFILDDPNAKLINGQSVVISTQQPKKIYQTNGFWFVVGYIVSTIITTR